MGRPLRFLLDAERDAFPADDECDSVAGSIQAMSHRLRDGEEIGEPCERAIDAGGSDNHGHEPLPRYPKKAVPIRFSPRQGSPECDHDGRVHWFINREQLHSRSSLRLRGFHTGCCGRLLNWGFVHSTRGRWFRRNQDRFKLGGDWGKGRFGRCLAESQFGAIARLRRRDNVTIANRLEHGV